VGFGRARRAEVSAFPLKLVNDRVCVRQVTQGVGHECHESIDDANYGGDLATDMRK
jgi:hypothetical protein